MIAVQVIINLVLVAILVPSTVANCEFEQRIGLLYACAVYRGVLSHPPRWP